MKLSVIKPQMSVRSTIRVDRPSIIMLFPDTNLTIQYILPRLNMLLANCRGIISPNHAVRYYNRRVTGRRHSVQLRQDLGQMAEEGLQKRIPVYNSLPLLRNADDADDEPQGGDQYYFYDMSVHMFGLQNLQGRLADKVLARTMMNHVSSTYQQIKTNLPTYNIDTFFFVNSEDGALYNLFYNIKKLLPPKDLQAYNFFDNEAFISNLDISMPLFTKVRGKTSLILRNYSRIPSLVQPEVENVKPEERETIDTTKAKDVDDLSQEKPEDIFTQDIEPQSRFLKSIDKTVRQDREFSTINVDELKDTLKNYKIKDPTVLANTKNAVDYYKQKVQKDTSDEDNEDLLNVVLKSIHYTIYGTDEIKDEYLHNPSLLINKIKHIQTYQVPLDFPSNDHVVDPKDIIDINYTTGQFRQKFEYTDAVHENVKKLFSTLESLSNHPVKIKNIDYEIKDNDRDRTIHYKITVQNQTGQNREPYTVELKVPGIVNERYFKLGGNKYIQSNQQVFKPITKTDKSEVRLLSNYAIVHVRTKNMRFNPSDVSQIINYLKVKYSHLIKNSDYTSYVTFTDGSNIYFKDNVIYSGSDRKIYMDENAQIVDDQGNQIKYGKNELIFEIVRSKIQADNPEDRLTTTKKNIPYLEIYLSGIAMPLIIYLWSQKGLLKTLTDLEIDYRIIDNKDAANSNEILITMNDGRMVACTYNQLREELILNGILASRVKNIDTHLDNPEIIHEHIATQYGSRSIAKINLITENQIDPITEELLEFEGYNKNFVNLVSNELIDTLLNKETSSLADLSIYRSRLSELVLNLMYKQIKMAHNKYQSEAEMGIENNRIYLDSDFIINSLLTDSSSLLQHAEPYNPLEEIMLSSRAVKTGKGGIPSQRAFKTQHRNTHESQYGNVGAISTPEHSSVGLTLHHTLTPVISNKWGSYGGKDITNLSGWNVLTLDEALILFQSSMDSDRACMARAHANQITPTKNAEPPLISTGAEFLVSQLSSKRFAQKAKKAGKIKEIVENKYMTIVYDDGTEETIDLIPRMSKTKRGSTLPLDMTTTKNVGDTFEKNELLAHTQNFSEDGIYTSGTNAFVAVMNYQGYSHEDAYVVSKNLADETVTDMIKEVQIIIPPHAKILNIEDQKNKTVNADDVLVEFAYEYDLNDYINTYELDSDDPDDVDGIYSQGQDSIKLLASLNGEIIDYKIFVNNKSTTDQQVINLHKQLVNEDQDLIKKLQKQKKTEHEKKETIDNISTDYMKVGGHKLRGGTEFEGAKIVYYIKYPKQLGVGDKIANRSALKGVISKILDPVPYGEFAPQVDIFVSPIGVFSRKNMSILKELYLGKIFYYLNVKAREMAEDNRITTKFIIQHILQIYEVLATEKVYKSVKQKLNNMDQNKFREQLQRKDKNTLFFVIEPFTNTSFDQIKKAADILEIPLDEKVYIPELGEWTSEPIPVGVAYYQFLEHHADVYSNVRGAERYTGVTRAPTKGKAKQGGQSIGNLDINALITLEANHLLHEFFTIRSDEHRSKRRAYSEIIETGELISLPTQDAVGGTHQLFNTYMTSLGLDAS